MRFRAGNRDLRAVARELDVRYLLEGSLRRAGNALRITAQLVDTTVDANLWSERFDGTLDDVFAIQERIARSIVSALRVRLSPEEEVGIMDRPIRDLKAYECYLRARQAIWTFTRDGNERAIALLGRGVDVEGDNALLFGTLGMAHSFLASLGVDSAENGAKSVRYAQAAFALDSDSPSGHTIMGMVALVAGDLSASAQSLRRVLAREPTNVDVMLVLANVYLCAGRTEKAAALLERCSELDPLLPLAHLMLGYLELMRGRYDQAVRHYEKDFELVESPIPMSVWGYEMALTAAGRIDEAFVLVDRLGPGAEADPHARMALMLRHALRGEQEEMLALLTPEFAAMALTQGYLARDIAAYHALVGRTADALEWLEHAIRGGFYNYPYFLLYRAYDSLREEPRFRELMGLAKARWEEFDA